jgi:hypothetical protein
MFTRKDTTIHAGKRAKSENQQCVKGSGEIESGYRYVIQQRLKISQAWRRPKNADGMLALRTTMANGD